MIRLLAKWAARKYYIFSQEFQASTADLHAGLSLKLAAEKRALIGQLNKDVDEIEANIKAVDEKLTAGYWECEGGHEWASMPNVRPARNHSAKLCVVNVNGNECGGEVRLIKRDLMTGQEKYESDKERNEAQTIAANKREQAKAEVENAVGSEKAAQYFKGQAANNRQVADKIRAL